MDPFIKLGRFVFAIPFAVFGIFHFMNASYMAGNMVPSFMPVPVFWVYLAGLGLILAAVSIIIQKKDKLAALLLALMLIIFVLTIHLPGVIDENQASMSNLLKDLSLAGGALIYAATAKDA